VRILHVTDCYLPRLGGIELQVHDLTSRQAAAGHDVTILTTTAGPPGRGLAGTPGLEDLRDGPRVRVLRAAPYSRPDGTPSDQIRYRSTRRGVAVLMADLDHYDMVHAHASSFSPLAFLAAHHASTRGVPTVATVHSLWAKATPLFGGADRLTGWGNWPVVWSAVSNAAASSIRGIVRDRAPVTILPNGVEPAEWRVQPDGAEPGRLRIAAVSRLARRKRVLQMVEILHAAHDQLPEGLSLDVRILGEGRQRQEIERYLRRHRMEGWVQLMGRRTRAEIRAALAGADLFLAPARLESFGVAALEARCAGLPVVALAGTGVEDFVAHGREGWLVRSDAAMVETIGSLARSPEVLARVAAHNRSVPASISWATVVDRCEELYRQAARRHGRRWMSVEAARPARAGPDVREVQDRLVSDR
jgi:glycosyltransferase involved in cell wall biosynthesis